MEKIATPPPLLAGYADAAAQESVRNVCLIHAGRKFREKLNDLFKNLRPKCLNSRAPSFAWRTNGLTISRKRRGLHLPLNEVYAPIGGCIVVSHPRWAHQR